MLTRAVLKSYLLDMPRGHIFDLTYRLFADVFPPGAPDASAREPLHALAGAQVVGPATSHIALEMGKGSLIKLDGPAASVFIADSDDLKKIRAFTVRGLLPEAFVFNPDAP